MSQTMQINVKMCKIYTNSWEISLLSSISSQQEMMSSSSDHSSSSLSLLLESSQLEIINADKDSEDNGDGAGRK